MRIHNVTYQVIYVTMQLLAKNGEPMVIVSIRRLKPIVSGSGDINFVEPYRLGNRNIWIFVGDLLLSDFEMELTNAWTQLLAGMERGF